MTSVSKHAPTWHWKLYSSQEQNSSQGASVSLNKSQNNNQDSQINIPVREAVGHVPPLLDHPAARELLEQYAPESSGAVSHSPTPQLPPPSYCLNSIS